MFGRVETFGALAADSSLAAPGEWMGSAHSRQFFKVLSLELGKVARPRSCLMGTALCAAANHYSVSSTPALCTEQDPFLPSPGDRSPRTNTLTSPLFGDL